MTLTTTQPHIHLQLHDKEDNVLTTISLSHTHTHTTTYTCNYKINKIMFLQPLHTQHICLFCSLTGSCQVWGLTTSHDTSNWAHMVHYINIMSLIKYNMHLTTQHQHTIHRAQSSQSSQCIIRTSVSLHHRHTCHQINTYFALHHQHSNPHCYIHTTLHYRHTHQPINTHFTSYNQHTIHIASSTYTPHCIISIYAHRTSAHMSHVGPLPETKNVN